MNARMNMKRVLHSPKRMAALERVKVAYTMHDVEGFCFRDIANVLGYAGAGVPEKQSTAIASSCAR